MADSEIRDASRPRIQSALRTVDILAAIAQSSSGLTAQQVANLLEIPLQTVYRLFRPLIGAQFIRRDDDGRYVLGPGAQELLRGFTPYYEHIDFAPQLEALAGSTRESGHVVGWLNGEIFVHAAVRGWPLNALVDIGKGPYPAAHSRAAGKLLLAFAEPPLRDEYLSKYPLERMTARTITDRNSLNEEFDLIRQQGYAVELEEFAAGVCALAVPVKAGGGDYAMGLSVPADRFHTNFPTLLVDARTHAAKVERSIIT